LPKVISSPAHRHICCVSCDQSAINVSTWCSIPWPCSGRVRCSAVQCSAVQCSAAQCSGNLGPVVVEHGARGQHPGELGAPGGLQCSAVQCSAVQCSAVQCSAVQCSEYLCVVRKAVQVQVTEHARLQCTVVHFIALHITALYLRPAFRQDIADHQTLYSLTKMCNAPGVWQYATSRGGVGCISNLPYTALPYPSVVLINFLR
jgi:hypothetical protein